jgi:uncharacterized membrane protein YhaH (DUF805 family)
VSKYFYNLANGRINRITFWVGIWLCFVPVYCVVYISIKPFDQFLNNLPRLWLDVAGFALVAAWAIFLISLLFRRLHDTNSEPKELNVSNWVAYDSPFAFDYRAIFKKGNPRENKYGKPPPSGVDLKGLLGL